MVRGRADEPNKPQAEASLVSRLWLFLLGQSHCGWPSRAAEKRAEAGVPDKPAIGLLGWEAGVPDKPAIGLLGWEAGVPDKPAIGLLGWEVGVPDKPAIGLLGWEVGVPGTRRGC